MKILDPPLASKVKPSTSGVVHDGEGLTCDNIMTVKMVDVNPVTCDCVDYDGRVVPVVSCCFDGCNAGRRYYTTMSLM